MKKWMMLTGLAMTLFLSACDNEDKLNAIVKVDSAFETGADGWTPGFSDYSTDTDSTTLEMEAERTTLPTGLDTTRYGYMLQGHNRADDMFMYLKKKVTGFVPNQTYSVVFNVNFGTQYPENSFGAGGSPGGSVYLKAGASPVEPVRKLEDKMYVFSLDKGAQSEIGKDAVLLGNVSNGMETFVYKLVERSNADKPFTVKANAQGEIWLYIGTDSGYEGLSVFYYDRITVTLTEQQI
ncbi:hypothetical protein FEM33_18640 [Dyadobacter flavalbus]|uniref:Lipoprotein n=1 Tax=Dyadobacter flavalbus TaxID=2579942 RepID=A0A5M8QTT0_9BACT|nr:hypothetical protein [Dyadobacter flavalbus]KAA6438678.1 hypothetical protein FEM33_18640 [Dyadobacter flavalbus]